MRSAMPSTTLPGSVTPGEALAAALEDGDAQLILQQLDLLGDARLRGIERFRRLGHIQALALDFDDVTQLLKFHGEGRCELLVVS